MATIALNRIDAFDATTEYVATFRYTGNQLVANKLIIYDSNTNVEVYNVKVSSMTQKHPIPAGTLTNGESYYATITGFYMNGITEESVTSSPSTVFLCLDTPTWSINIEPGEVINASSYEVEITYIQKQGEPIDEFQIDVFTASKVLFWSSGILYNASEKITIDGLNDGDMYYIRAYGITTHGMAIDTRDASTKNDINFAVKYDTPGVFSMAYLTQNKYEGWVRITTDIASIEGYSGDGSEIKYVNNNTAADLSDGNIIVFDKNFQFSKDYTLIFQGKNFAINKPFLEFSDGSESYVALIMRKGTFEGSTGERWFIELLASGGAEHVIFSEKFAPLPTSAMLQVFLTRTGGLYNIIVTMLS